ncbi:MAG: hypothetical protein JRD69_02355 [Deltaproteobacteria bacterium]|nr:hypothetical protein [Deltaproteobacteria bacterium]
MNLPQFNGHFKKYTGAYTCVYNGEERILIYQHSVKEIEFPFNLAHIRRIEYENSATGGRKLEEELKETLEHVLSPKLHA